MRIVYSLLSYLLLPVVFGYFLFRAMKEPAYARGWGQRLGFGSMSATGSVWIHAASVGEVQAAAPLIRALAEQYPSQSLLVTVFTPTGLERARAQFAGVATLRYLPLDVPGAVRRFLRRTRPRLGINVETELWPNLLHHCGRRSIPVVIANASISERSASRYAHPLLCALMRSTLSNVTRVCAASAADAARFATLGLPDTRIVTTGNLKFDLVYPATVMAQGGQLRGAWDRQHVWVAASTHAGEELAALKAQRLVQEQFADALLVLVPRHPQRFDAVATLCDQQGLHTARRSRGEFAKPQTSVYLADTLGELPSIYAAADVAFVGGSLVAGIGGHNLLEPAALGRPIVAGTHLDGVRDVAQLLGAEGALVTVADAQALAGVVGHYFADVRAHDSAADAATRVVASHSGALNKTLDCLSQLLPAISAAPE